MGGSISTLSFQMGNQTFHIPDLQDSMTVYNLKKSVHAHSGVCIMDQTLLYKATKLVDDRKLSSYNIKEGDTIVVKVEARTTPELFIESNSGTRLAQVAFNPDNTVAEVKQLIQAKTKVAPACQKLFFGRTLLKDGVTLSNCSIKEGDVLRLEILPSTNKVIIVEMPDMPVIELNFDPNQTIQNLKQAIKDKIRISPDEQRLFFNDSHLEEKRTLAHYNIQAGNTIIVTNRTKSDIQLYIDAPYSVLTLQDLKPTSLIQVIKEKIHQESGIALKEQVLEWEGKELDNGKSLADYDIQDGAKIKLSLRVVSEVFVKFREESIKLRFSANDTVFHLKTLLIDLTGVPFDHQKLIFSGKVLENGKKLSDYGIQKESVIYLLEIPPKTNTQQIYPILVQPDAKVSEVKTMIAPKLNSLPGDQQISFCERVLSDDRTLGSYDVKNDSTLLVKVKQNPKGVRSRSITLPIGSPGIDFSDQEASVEDGSVFTPIPENSVPPPLYNPDANLAQFDYDRKTVLVATERPDRANLGVPGRLPRMPHLTPTIIIKVSVLCCNNFELEIAKTETILGVKTKLEETKWFDRQLQRIFFNDIHCENESTLSQLGIRENDKLEVDMLQVWKLAHRGNEHEVECYARTTIAKFKEEIEKRTGISTQQQHLFTTGAELSDEKTLSHYRLKPREAIHLLTYTCVRVQLSTGNTLTISKCKLDKTTGLNLKEQMCEHDGIPVKYISLKYKGKTVSDTQTLDIIRFEMGTHITANVDSEKSDKISLFIRLPTGDKHLVRMHSLDTVGKLKNAVEHENSMADDSCSCVFKGERLKDGDVLQYYKIVELSEIELIPTSSTTVNLILMNGVKKVFSFKPSERVEETLRQIRYKFELPTEHTKLFYGNDRLIFLSQFRISNGDCFYIGTEDSFLITVQPEWSRPIKLLVSNDEKVSSLKLKIERSENFLVSLQTLYLSGREMLDADVIRKYNMSENAIVILKLRPAFSLISIPVTDQCNNTQNIHNINPYKNVSELRNLISKAHPNAGEQCRIVFGSILVSDLGPLCAFYKNASCVTVLSDRKDCLNDNNFQQQHHHPSIQPRQSAMPQNYQNQQYPQDPNRVFQQTIAMGPDPYNTRRRNTYADFGPDQNAWKYGRDSCCKQCYISPCTCNRHYVNDPRMANNQSNIPFPESNPLQTINQHPSGASKRSYPTDSGRPNFPMFPQEKPQINPSPAIPPAPIYKLRPQCLFSSLQPNPSLPQYPPPHQSLNSPQHQPFNSPQHQPFNSPQHQPFNSPQHQPSHPQQHQPLHPQQHQPLHPQQHQPLHPQQHQPSHPQQHQPLHPQQHQPLHPQQHQPSHPQQHQPLHPQQHQPLHPQQHEFGNLNASGLEIQPESLHFAESGRHFQK